MGRSVSRLDSAPSPVFNVFTKHIHVFWKAADASLWASTWDGHSLAGAEQIRYTYGNESPAHLACAPASLYGYYRPTHPFDPLDFSDREMMVFWMGDSAVRASDSGQLWYGTCTNDPTGRGGPSWSGRQLSQKPMASMPVPLYNSAERRVDVFWKSPDGALWTTWCTSVPGTKGFTMTEMGGSDVLIWG